MGVGVYIVVSINHLARLYCLLETQRKPVGGRVKYRHVEKTHHMYYIPIPEDNTGTVHRVKRHVSLP